ncbi:uncharacterized protein LOC118562259 isoform X1 [Fundulus heteroclitus]|uniref:uncharacterized protein LOC118562259 isoform X1 n=1 Tax=Fundulus heteroclitus TaxID=8078 RepID=UPI00165AF635|nr:uncharacterized protein LOC118562259 isoform X1 [Fundulus heteroclitus]
MLPSSNGPICWTARPDSLWLWTNPSFSCPTWVNLPATAEPYYSRSMNGFVDCSAMLVPPPPLTPDSARTASRKLILRRSLLDLVLAHYFMALTDRELLHWYLSLPLEDRNIILGEGGLHHFLESHPNLKLDKGYVYVKQDCTQNLHRVSGCQFLHPPNQDSVTLSRRTASTTQEQSYWSAESSTFVKQQGTDSMKSPQSSDENGIYPTHFLQDPYSGPAGENILLDDKNTAGKNMGTRLSFEDEKDKFQSLMANETSVLNAEAPTNPVSDSSISLAACCKPLKVKTTAEKCTLTTPCAPTFDATTNTKVVRCSSSHTQTEGVNTTEQHTVTEVHMTDLDRLTKEFIKLKMLQISKEPKAKIQSTGQGTQKHEGAEDSGHPDEGKKRHQETKPVEERNEAWRDAALVPKEEIAKQISCDEVDLSEVWYDAEDELQLPGQAAAVEISPNSDIADGQNAEPVNDESSYSVLYASNLPSNVTQLIDQPLSSIQRRNVVYILPSPKGTCVPQHFGTMDSLGALMAELMQLHPDIGWQRIMDALMEAKGTHQGVLGSLPLSTIRDMISDLLTKSATVTQT